MNHNRVLDALKVTTEVCGGREFSPAAAKVIAHELSLYPEAAVLKSLDRCRRELRSLTLVDILSRIEDGRPGVEEAWAMLPKDEAETVVWTPEIASAYVACLPLLGEDPIAARMAFKETYSKLLAEARTRRSPAEWTVSLGTDASRREGALKHAVEKNRISMHEAHSFLPHLPPDRAPFQITGPVEPVHDVSAFIADITSRISTPETKPGPVNEFIEAKKRAEEQIKQMKELEKK